jgi:hypothetical protein
LKLEAPDVNERMARWTIVLWRDKRWMVDEAGKRRKGRENERNLDIQREGVHQWNAGKSHLVDVDRKEHINCHVSQPT